MVSPRSSLRFLGLREVDAPAACMVGRGAHGCRSWFLRASHPTHFLCAGLAGVGLGLERSTPRPAFLVAGCGRASVLGEKIAHAPPSLKLGFELACVGLGSKRSTPHAPPLRQPTVSLKYSTRASVLVQKDRRPHHLHLNARFSLHKRAVRKFDLSCCCLVGGGCRPPLPHSP